MKVIKKNLPQNKNPGPTGFTGELYQTFRYELMPFLLKCFQKISEGETLPNSFYKASITLIPKTWQRLHKKRKLQANITDEHRCKNLQQTSKNKIQLHIKKFIHQGQVDLFQGSKDSFFFFFGVTLFFFNFFYL